MNKFRDVAIGLLCIVLLGGILWYGYDKYHGTEAKEASESTKTEVIIPTLEERLNDWNVESMTWNCTIYVWNFQNKLYVPFLIE